MSENPRRWSRWALPLQGVLLALLAVLAAYALHRSQVVLSFEVATRSPTRLQVYFHPEGLFNENDTLKVRAPAGKSIYRAAFDGDEARNLRWDPPAGAQVAICDLRLDDEPLAYTVIAADQLEWTRTGGCLRLAAKAGASDPRLVSTLAAASAKRAKRAVSWRKRWWLSLGAFVLLGSWVLYRHRLRLLQRLPRAASLAWGELLERHLHWIAAALMLAFGLGYAWVTPPGAVADEEAHLGKVMRIRAGDPFGGSGDRLLIDTRRMYGAFKNFPQNKQPFTQEQVQALSRPAMDCKPSTIYLSRGANHYFPHHYLLGSLALGASCASGWSFHTFLSLARVLNLLLAAALVAWGVRCATHGRWTLLLMALLPMSMFQMASVSADSLTLGLCLAWIGLVSGIVGRKIAPADAGLGLWTLSLAIALLKPGAAWILAALLFCKPAYDAAGQSFLRAAAHHLLLPWAIHVAWTLVASTETRPLAGVDVQANIATLLHQPQDFAVAAWNTYFGPHGLRLARQLVGVLGWLDVWLPKWVYSAAALSLAATLWMGMPRWHKPRFAAPLAMCFALGAMVLVTLPLYLYWTPTTLWFVQGLQGRYFLVIAAFVLAWCALRPAPAVLRAWIGTGLLAWAVAINAVGLWTLHQAYWVVGRA